MSLALVTTTVTFRDSNNSLVSPETVSLRVRYGETWTPFGGTINNPSTGVFNAVVTCNDAGIYEFEWYGKITSSGLERYQTAQVDVQ